MFKRWTSSKQTATSVTPPPPKSDSSLTGGSQQLRSLFAVAKAKSAVSPLPKPTIAETVRGSVVESISVVAATSPQPPPPALDSPQQRAARDVAGHLAGLVAAATAQPLTATRTSAQPTFAPKLLGTARRFGLTTVANMARFATQLHHFSTNLRLSGPKDRRHIVPGTEPTAAAMTAEESLDTTEAAEAMVHLARLATTQARAIHTAEQLGEEAEEDEEEEEEAGLGSEDSGIGNFSIDYDTENCPTLELTGLSTAKRHPPDSPDTSNNPIEQLSNALTAAFALGESDAAGGNDTEPTSTRTSPRTSTDRPATDNKTTRRPLTMPPLALVPRFDSATPSSYSPPPSPTTGLPSSRIPVLSKKSNWLSKMSGKLGSSKSRKSLKEAEVEGYGEAVVVATGRGEKKLRRTLRRPFRRTSRKLRDTAADGDITSSSPTSSSSSSSEDDEDDDVEESEYEVTERAGQAGLRRWTLDIGSVIRRRSAGVSDAAGKRRTSLRKRGHNLADDSDAAAVPGAAPTVASGDDDNETLLDSDVSDLESERDSANSAGSNRSASSIVTVTTQLDGMHCVQRRTAYLRSVRKLQDARRPLAHVVGVQSVLAEVRRIGGVRVPVREVHAALAAGERDMTRRRRRLASNLSARRAAINESLSDPGCSLSAAPHSVIPVLNSTYGHRRPRSWPHGGARPVPLIARCPSPAGAAPIPMSPDAGSSQIAHTIDRITNEAERLTIDTTGMQRPSSGDDEEEDDRPLAFLCSPPSPTSYQCGSQPSFPGSILATDAAIAH